MVESERDIGRIEGKLAAMEDRIAHYEQMSSGRLNAIDRKLDGVITALAQQSGGVRLAYVLTMAAAAAGGWLTHLFGSSNR